MKHITPIQAELYLKKETGLIQSTRIKQHIGKCTECAELIKEAQQDIDFAKELRDAVNDIPDNAASEIEEQTQLNIKKRITQSASQLNLKAIFFLVTAFLLSFPDTLSAEKTEADARIVIRSLQKEIKKKLQYSPQELKKKKTDFQEYYITDINPRLSKIAAEISSDAIHWVDLNWDDKPELIFWTEGLSPTAWGAKEFLFVAKLSKKGTYEIIKSVKLDDEPSRQVKKYSYSRFWSHPNKGKGYNDFLGAVFSYAVFGGSASTFVNYEIGWNGYQDTVTVDKFLTSFAIDIKAK